jgi:hypothetical protein
MNIQHKSRLLWSVILIAWIFDLLFWKKAPGISFLIMVILTLVGGLLLSLGEGIRPAKNSWFLLIPVLFFSAMTVFREEPFTMFINYLLTVAAMALLAVTYTGGKWWNYSFSDYVSNFFKLFLSAISKTLMLFVGKEKKEIGEETNEAAPKMKGTTSWSIIRGLLLALPIVLVLAALLASADPIFNQNFEAVLKLFKIEKLGEYLFRAFYILILGYFLAGTYLHAYTSSKDDHLIGLEKPWLPPFLGWIESIIILLGIDLLFGFFVGIQFKYFFGGQTNIHIDGFTFAEYARKGFSELVIVAVISLLIMQVLNSIGKRQMGKQSTIFTTLSVGLVALVCVILVSAFQRLQLYEGAYGFSRLRTYTHVFMIWIGVLLAIIVVLEVLKKSRMFALAVVLAVFGFGISLNIMNVDGFIAQQNIGRAVSGSDLDVAYLVSLSNDAIPVLSNQYQNQALPENVRDLTGAALACKSRIETDFQSSQFTHDYPWPSYLWSRSNAVAIMNSLKPKIDSYSIQEDSQQLLFIKVGGTMVYCQGSNMEGID